MQPPRDEPVLPPEVEPPMPKTIIQGIREVSHGERLGMLVWTLGLLVLSGCAAVRPAPKVPVVELPVAPVAPPPAPPTSPAVPPTAANPPTPPPAPVAPAVSAAPAARQMMLVESTPPGAIIVVNGRPVGKAPVRLDVPATPQGFFREDLEIRARFVARDEMEVSRTAMEKFSPREKVPAVLHFTRDGAQRTVR